MRQFPKYIFALLLLGSLQKISAQNPVQYMGRMGQGFGNMQQGGKADSLQKRDKNADSITIYYKLYNSNEIKKLDTSVNDFFVHFPIPYTNYNLGSLGTATQSYLFNANKTEGWDPGFHAFDGYMYHLEATPFYQTTRPYTELGYLLGGMGEQLVEIKHTQNKKQQLNYSFEYRFSNAPGYVKNQNANINNMRITGHYQSKRKRYETYFVYLANKTASSENGGLVNAAKLDSLSLNNPYELETRLGLSGLSFRNPFNTNIATGTTYKQNLISWRNTYDLGQKDSIVKDTIVTHLFYPRIRFQNDIKIQSSQFVFADANPSADNYLQYFGVVYDSTYKNKSDTWALFTDEFSVISYPEKKNSNQFLQLGLGYTQMNASFSTRPSWNGYDMYGFATYKNKTRNQRWDVLASGKLFINGHHAGDYSAQANLSRQLSQNGSFVKIAFQNISRTPSDNLYGITSFPISPLSTLSKENTTQLDGVLANPIKGWNASVNYQMVNNFHYFTTGLQPIVYTPLLSYLRGQMEHRIHLSKHWNWYNQLTVQVVDPNAPIHVPLLLTRQRIAFEGNFYKNLDLSTGLELIYHTNYKADGYMPFTSQFYYQNSEMTQNRPTANAFLHFMIKRFKGYIRVENLNTLLPSSKALGSGYNFTAPNYPSSGMWFRVGIWWNFIN
ncbi:MAG: hypothetical protein RLZ56_1042 [Bacteroidota bacterium]|jgi:hypothetical protein